MRKKNTIIIIKLLVTLIIVIFLFAEINVDELKSNIIKMDTKYLLFALLLLPVNIFFQVYKWYVILRSVEKKRTPIYMILETSLIGILMGFVTPGKTGEMAKFLLIKNEDKFEMAGGTFYEKILDSIWILVFALPPVLSIGNNLDNSSIINRIIIPVICLITFFSIVVVIFNRYKNKNNNLVRNLGKVTGFYKTAGKVRFLQLTIGSLFLFLTYSTQLALLLKAFNGSSFLINLEVSWFSIFLKSLLPISFGDVGIRESAAAYSCKIFLIPIESGVASGFLLFSINVVIPSILGLVLFLRSKRFNN
ncbi:MAG: flippase-like domain-containing protein [Candidatus Delongbacteria bacterium]|nr:flippase-like domain-containing protein [Candidatus Delongbacteria bacterium]MBN2835834.1 flippase-like domain-containing protein [Candidatus Delongbacteria bacterium]